MIDVMKVSGEVEQVRSQYFKYQQKKYLPVIKPNLSVLSGQELEHIDNVLQRLAHKTARDLSDYSHGDIPWKVSEEGQPIDYETVFYRDKEYSVKIHEDAV